jgi:hypothetical protein
MKKRITLLLMIVSLIGCTNPFPSEPPALPPTLQVSRPSPTAIRSPWGVYDPDPDHLWNRVFRQFYQRTSTDGKEYGADELDPLLWFDTTYLLHGPSHQQAVQVLDQFLATYAEDLIQDPLRRALFQRDLWAVFDWLASQTEPYPAQRQVLETRLAQIIRRVALSKEQIHSLPDNYALEAEAHIFPAEPPADRPEAAFLPSDLFRPDSAWLPMGREGGPIAMTHTEAFPFFGRSVFLVFVRSPAGRTGTLDFIKSLNIEPNPVTAVGTDVALGRRMLLIDDQGQLVLSPLVETVQIRHFGPMQSFHEFELSRSQLLEGRAGGLLSKTELFMLFMSHGDVFAIPDLPDLRATIPEICKSCHFHDLSALNFGNTRSIISYSRQPFPLPDKSKPVLFPTTVDEEAQTVIEWKHQHQTWKALEALRRQAQLYEQSGDRMVCALASSRG